MILEFFLTGGSAILSISAMLFVVLTYGYIEAISGRGYVVAILFGLYLAWSSKYFFMPLLFTVLQILSAVDGVTLLYNFDHRAEIRLCSFGALLLISLFLEQRERDDTVVSFRPYEEDIRQFLMERDPNLLPRVDSLLIKYKGKEKQLFQKLQAKYSGSTPFGSPLKSF